MSTLTADLTFTLYRLTCVRRMADSDATKATVLVAINARIDGLRDIARDNRMVAV
jgi:hypothetical protein